ncbi:multidrug transporter MatE [Intrasporangium oryzae NRRL B-24470]|uniref:Probable multidrug resistance protein NorM n=2 Tax=Intrasporangium TaxID=53357 RepID=W9G8Y2_9MICO|nr:multidrug transporter MatE [Intrasporangium oryzae NRRL B-24470]
MPSTRTEQSTTPSPAREIARIAVPVSMEFVLMLVLNFVNQIVVGGLGATAIAAVGFSNSLTFILAVTLGCIGTSVSILVARAHGAGRRGDLDHTVTAAVLVALAVGGVVSVVPWFLADHLLGAVGASPSVAAAGTDYFRLTVLATLPVMLSAILSGVLRSVGRPTSPMIATMVTVVANSVIAYSLVVGVGPLPSLGVAGAGWATLVTAVAKTGILLVMAYGRSGVIGWSLPDTRAQWRAVVVPLFVLALPLGVTELFWTVGTFLYNVVFQQLGDRALAAAQIVTTLEGVFVVGSIGLMSATTTLVGRSIGRGDVGDAVAWVRRLTRAGIGTAVVFGVLFAASVLLLDTLFGEAGREVRTMAGVGILLNALFQVVKVRNMIIGAGVLPSANDVRGVIIGDVVGAFGVGLPLAVLLGLHTPLGFVGVVLARIVEELVKLAVFTWRARRVSWDRLVVAA